VPDLSYHWLENIDYAAALSLQEQLRAEVIAGERPGALLMVTHPHTVTIGRHGDDANVTSPQLLEAAGCRVHRVDRGGDVTYHGPEQLVGYPIVHLGGLKLGTRAYICRLAQTIAAVLADFGVETRYDDDAPGLWVGRDKIVAFGVHVRRQVTTHGFSINVAPDLQFYDLIVPCGLRWRGVTSMARVLGSAPALPVVRDAVIAAFGQRFGVQWVDSVQVPNIMPTFASKGSSEVNA